MGLRGELFSARARSANDRRTYFFNVKENRSGDRFVTVVESKKSDDESFDRHQVVVFEDDLREFSRGLQAAIDYLDQSRGLPERRDGRPTPPRPRDDRPR